MLGSARLNGSLHCWQADTIRSGVHAGGFAIFERSSSGSDRDGSPLA
jgi:hypothetical protein